MTKKQDILKLFTQILDLIVDDTTCEFDDKALAPLIPAEDIAKTVIVNDVVKTTAQAAAACAPPLEMSAFAHTAGEMSAAEDAAMQPPDAVVTQAVPPSAIPEPVNYEELDNKEKVASSVSSIKAIETAKEPGGVDSRGITWDKRIHGANKALTKDGQWKNKRSVNKDLLAQVEQELIATAIASAKAEPVTPIPSVPLTTIAAVMDEAGVAKRMNILSSAPLTTLVVPNPMQEAQEQAVKSIENLATSTITPVIDAVEALKAVQSAPPVVFDPKSTAATIANTAHQPDVVAIAPVTAGDTVSAHHIPANAAIPMQPVIVKTDMKVYDDVTVPQSTKPAHSLESFTSNFAVVLANLLREKKIDEDYVNSLKVHFQVTELWEVLGDPVKLSEFFNSLCDFGLITKVD